VVERIGQCHCGSLRVIATGEPERVYLCHCKACQRRTGTAFHFGATYRREQVPLAGERKIYERDADSGDRIRFHFCPNCGSTLYWEGDRNPAVCGVAVGAFDTSDGLAAQRFDLGRVDSSMARLACEYGASPAGPTTSHVNCGECSIRERRENRANHRSVVIGSMGSNPNFR